MLNMGDLKCFSEMYHIRRLHCISNPSYHNVTTYYVQNIYGPSCLNQLDTEK